MADTEWSRTPFGAEHLGLIGEVALLAGQLEFFVQELSIVLTEPTEFTVGEVATRGYNFEPLLTICSDLLSVRCRPEAPARLNWPGLALDAQQAMRERNRLLHGTWRWDLFGIAGESDARLSSRKRQTGRRSDAVAVLPEELEYTADALQSAGLRLRQVMFEVAQELGALDELAHRQSLSF